MTEIKYVTAQDKSFWYTLDKQFSDDLIEIAKEMYGDFYGN